MADQHGPQAARQTGNRYWWVAAALASLTAGAAFAHLRERPGDTAVYRLAAERYLRGEPIYNQKDQAAFTYPPFFVFAYLPFSLLPPPWDRALWLAMNLMLLLWIVGQLRNMLWPRLKEELQTRHHRILWLVACCALSMRFALSPFTYQSHEYIVLALVIAGIRWWPRSELFSGCAMGIAAACKATPLLFLIVFVWRRHWTAVASLLLAATLATVLPDIIELHARPTVMFWEWYTTFVSHVDVGSAPEVAGAWRRWNALNQSVSGTLYRLSTHVTRPSPWQWDVCIVPLDTRWQRALIHIAQLGILALVLASTWRGKGQARRPDPTGALFMGSSVLCGMLLLSPMSSRQHFCSLLPAIFALMFEIVSTGPRPAIVVAVTLLAALGSLGGKDIVGAEIQQQMSAYGAYTWCALACLGACTGASRRWMQRAVGVARHPPNENAT